MMHICNYCEHLAYLTQAKLSLAVGIGDCRERISDKCEIIPNA